MPTTYSSADAIADIPGATYEDLLAKYKALGTVVGMVSAERKALMDEIKLREAEAKAKLRLGNISEADRAVYRGVLDAMESRG